MSRRHISDLTEQLREISRELERLTFEHTVAEDGEIVEERRRELEQQARRAWHELDSAVGLLTEPTRH